METNSLAPPHSGENAAIAPGSAPRAIGHPPRYANAPETLQAAIAKLFLQGTPSEQIAQGLLATAPEHYQLGMNTLALLQFQANILQGVGASFEPYYTHIFDLLYQALLWNDPDKILEICAAKCNRRDYAFCEVAVDYIEKNYEPSWYEQKALQNKLYQMYSSGASPDEIRAEVSGKNKKFRYIVEAVAEIAVQYPCFQTKSASSQFPSIDSIVKEIPLSFDIAQTDYSAPELDLAESSQITGEPHSKSESISQPIEKQIEEPVDYWTQDESASDDMETESVERAHGDPILEEFSDTIVTDTFSNLPNYSRVVSVNPKAPLLLSQHEEKNLLFTVASLEISALIAAPSGTGKSTFSRAYIDKYYQLHPDANFYICCQKNDFWLGLRNIPGAVARPDYDEETGLWNFEPILEHIRRVNSFLNQRRLLHEEQREGLPKIVLFLDDYYSIWNTISGSKKYASIKDFITESLANIITLGRELGIIAVILTQSFNLESLGLTDSNIRDNLAILILGNIVKTLKGMQGNYNALYKIIRNPFVVGSDSARARMLNLLDKLVPVSMELQRPIAFSSIGDGEVMFLQDYRWSKDCRLSDEQLDAIAQRFGCARNASNN